LFQLLLNVNVSQLPSRRDLRQLDLQEVKTQECLLLGGENGGTGGRQATRGHMPLGKGTLDGVETLA
jgi:hypothetical protein